MDANKIDLSSDPMGLVAGKKEFLSGVKFMNKKGLLLAITALTVTLAATFIAMTDRGNTATTDKNESDTKKSYTSASSDNALNAMGVASEESAAKLKAHRDQKERERELLEARAKASSEQKTDTVAQAKPLPSNLPAAAGQVPKQAGVTDQMAAQREIEKQKQAEELMKAAYASNTALDFGSKNGAAGVNSTRDEMYEKILNQANRVAANGAGTGLPNGANGQQRQLSDVERNEQFLSKAEQYSNETLLEKRRAPISRFEVKSGGVIPAVLETAINSDLPGMVTARIQENVYDTISGRHLMIPQGAKVVGRYDADTVYGQERVLLVWDRIIYPDGSSMSIKGMQGADGAGQAGFADEVDRHFWRAFQSAFLMSMMSAAVQQSQPQQQQGSAYGNPTYGQTMGQEMGRMFGQLGMEIVRKGLNIKPTITVRAGYQFNIMINKDMVFDGPYTE